MRRKIKIDIQSRWHVGSGYGDGPGADALVVRTAEGLPYLPGKTLKGLLRDGCRLAEDVGQLPVGTTNRLFGTAETAHAETLQHGMQRFYTHPGSLYVHSGLLGKTDDLQEQWRRWARHEPQTLDVLFQLIHSTAIDQDGIAKEKTLRSFEFAVPMQLYAVIEGPPEDLALLSQFLPLIRELGTRRRRGFGRCAMTVVED